MQGVLLACLTSGLLLGSQEPDPKPDPRAIVRKAIASHAETYQGKRLAVYQRVEGKEDKLGSYKGEMFSQPNGARKMLITLAVQGQELRVAVIYNGAKGWLKIDGPQRLAQPFQ